MNTLQKIDFILDLFTHSVTMIDRLGAYKNMSEDDKFLVDELFYKELYTNKIKFDKTELEYFNSEYPTSFITHTLESYVNNNVNARMSEIDILCDKLNKMTGKRITMVKFSDFGMPIVIHTTLDHAENKSYAQYKEALYIIHKPKNKRKLFRNIITGREVIAVFEGWIDIDTNVGYEVSNDNGITVKQSKYYAHDEQFIIDAIQSSNDKVYVSMNI